MNIDSLGSSKELFHNKNSNCSFNQTKNIYAEKLIYLNSLDTLELIKEFLSSGLSYRFSEYSIKNNNYSESIIKDSFNCDIVSVSKKGNVIDLCK